MKLYLALILFVIGLAMVIYSAEKMVVAIVRTSRGFGISAFLISVIFIGFDPENLAVGAAGSYEGVSGIALGAVIGAAMVAIALAFGITALFVPMKFEKVPRQILMIPVLAILLLGILVSDFVLSTFDGILLLAVYVLTILWLIRLNRKGFDVQAGGEIAESLEKSKQGSKWKSLGRFILSLAAIIIGSEMIVRGSETLIARSGLSDTFFGMTILAFLVSIEELARELPAAIKGRPDISYGNVSGSILAFFLFNAGIIALINPVQVEKEVLYFYLPVCFLSIWESSIRNRHQFHTSNVFLDYKRKSSTYIPGTGHSNMDRIILLFTPF